LTSLQLLDLHIAEDEAAELKPVAAALQRLTGAQGVVLCGCRGVLGWQLLQQRAACGNLDIAEDEAAELKPVAAALQRLPGGPQVVLVVIVVLLLDLDIAGDEAAELKPVAAALQRLTGGQ
jgi:hypothetical protein